MKPFFITVDGIDGAGKSSNLAAMRAWFEARQLPVLFTREPGGTDIGEAIRLLLLNPATRANVRTETLLLFAARQQHVDEIIRPALTRGVHVVCDRFTDATFAYQGGGRGLALDDIAVLAQWVQQGLEPNLTLLLDVPLKVSLERLARNGSKDRFEQEDADFFERTRQVYLQRAQARPQQYAVIDSSQPKADVADQIQATLNGLFGTHP